MSENFIPVWIKEQKNLTADVALPQRVKAARERHWEAINKSVFLPQKSERFKYCDFNFLQQQIFNAEEKTIADEFSIRLNRLVGENIFLPIAGFLSPVVHYAHGSSI